MAVNETGQINTDDKTSDSQASVSSSVGRTNSARSNVIEGFSFRLSGVSHPRLNNGAESGQNVFRAEEFDNHEMDVNRHHLTGIIPFSVENAYEDGPAPSQLMRDDSIAHGSSSGASLRRLFSVSGALRPRLDRDLENEIVSQAGDIGDRIVSRRGSQRESFQFDREQGVVFPIPEELLDSCGFWSNDPNKANTISPVSPLVSEIITPLSTSSLLHNKQDEKKELPPSFEYIAYLIHMAVFGILGILTRYLLQKLFGSSVVGVTSDQSILYLDLPSNMDCFLLRIQSSLGSRQLRVLGGFLEGVRKLQNSAS